MNFIPKIFICAILLVTSFSIVNAASPLSDYHIRVHQAGVEISTLFSDADEDESYRAYQQRVDTTLYNVRSLLPPHELVEFANKTTQVNNEWLHSEIGEFYKLQSYDKKRDEALVRIEEYLNALDNRLTELDGKKLTGEKSSTRFPVSKNPNEPLPQQNPGGQQGDTPVFAPGSNQQTSGNQLPSGEGAQQGNTNQPKQNTTTNQTPSNPPPPAQNQGEQSNPAQNTGNAKDKEAEKAKMNEILHRDEYSKEPPKESAIQRFLNGLFNREPKKEPQKQEPKQITPLAAIIQYLVIGIAFAAIAYVLWKLVPRFLRRERKAKKEKRGPRVILGETLDEDQTATDLLAEADRLARAGDIRAAIRKGYIALLCELGDRQVLALSQYKTNRDYLRDVRTKIMLYAAMEQLTNSFERHWYGFEPSGENDWNNFRNYYQQAVKN